MNEQGSDPHFDVQICDNARSCAVLNWLASEAATEIRADEARSGLFAVHTAGKLAGAIWANLLPGRVASIIGPKVRHDDGEMAYALIDAVDRYLADRDVQVTQVVLSPDNPEQARWYQSAGYTIRIELDFLFASLDRIGPEHCAEWSRDVSRLGIEKYAPDRHARLVDVLSATYTDSLDCPGLNGMRDVSDVLASHQAVGLFSADRWFLLADGTQDVGCLLLTDHPSRNECELVYMGIVPEARGRGYGLLAAQLAQLEAIQMGRKRVVLAVDALNGPAQSVYTKAGFAKWDQKNVLLRV